MRAVDTNVLVRLIVRDNASQLILAERFVENGAWISTLALTEAVWVLRTVYALTATQQADAIDMLTQKLDVVLQDREAVAAALDLFRAKPSLGFADCLILETARKAGHLPLGTFDKSLSRVEGAQKL